MRFLIFPQLEWGKCKVRKSECFITSVWSADAVLRKHIADSWFSFCQKVIVMNYSGNTLLRSNFNALTWQAFAFGWQLATSVLRVGEAPSTLWMGILSHPRHLFGEKSFAGLLDFCFLLHGPDGIFGSFMSWVLQVTTISHCHQLPFPSCFSDTSSHSLYLLNC
jgi:hypothetical protein